jgi:lysophospholipase L1-like esterase
LYFGSREPVMPLSHYLDNLGILLRLMRERTRAALVWASTTPVVDADAHAAHAQWRDFDRYDADVVRYNAAARDLMRAHGVDVLDLYALVAARGAKTMQSGDGVHYTEDGSRALGDAVADFILPRLSSRR